MLNSNVAGIVWKITPVNTQETIAMICDIIMAEDYIATELGIIQDLLHVVIHNKLPRCQHVVSQNSLDLI